MNQYRNFIKYELKQSKNSITFIVLILTIIIFLISDFQYKNYPNDDYNHVNNRPGIDYKYVLKNNKLVLNNNNKNILSKEIINSIKFQNEFYPKAIEYYNQSNYKNLNKIETIIFIHESYFQLVPELKDDYRKYTEKIVEKLGYSDYKHLIFPKNLKIGEKNDIGSRKVVTDYKYKLYENNVMSINYRNKGTIPFLETLFSKFLGILVLFLVIIFSSDSITSDQSQGVYNFLFFSEINRKKYYYLKFVSSIFKITICLVIPCLLIFIIMGMRTRFNSFDTPILVNKSYLNSFMNQPVDYKYQREKFGASYVGIVETDFSLDGITKIIDPSNYEFINYGKYLLLEAIYLITLTLLVVAIVQFISSIAKDGINSFVYSTFILLAITIISKLVYRFCGGYYIGIGQFNISQVLIGGNTTSLLYFLFVSIVFIVILNIIAANKYDKKDIV